MSFKFKLMLPAVAASALLALFAVLAHAGVALSPLWFALAGAVLLPAAWILVEVAARRPLLQLAERVHAMVNAQLRPPFAEHFDSTPGVLERAVNELGEAREQQGVALERERALRRQLEDVLRESEERYALALRCVNDGLWEWDLKTGGVYYAPTWKSALGWGDADIGEKLDEWHDRIHPEDRAAVLHKLECHIAGDEALFECDQRLLHRDGQYRWFLTRGRALRSASGKTYKMIGLNTDITARKRAEHILNGVARGLATAGGEDFFRLIVKNFAEVLQVKYAFITECVDHPPSRVRMLAAWMDGAYSDNIEYDLAETPCDVTVGDGRVSLIAAGLEQLYPREAGYESFLGIPICDTAGRVIGHLACFDVKPMAEDLPVMPIFTIFAMRAGVEMEHQFLLRRLGRQPGTALN